MTVGPLDASARPGRLPTFLIIGVPKAGTSALALWLSEHPDVFIPAGKELHFFTKRYARGLDWYRRQFPLDGARHVGEASPGYMFSKVALSRMAEVVPDAKLIAILRQPVDRAYSHYWMLRTKFPTKRSFQELARAEVNGDGDSDFPPILSMGRYIAQLKRVRELYRENQLLVLLYDDLSARPGDLFASLCGYLGIETAPAPNIGTVVNPATMVRSERFRRALLRMRVGKWLPRSVVVGLDRVNRVPERYPPMDQALRGELLEWYREDIDALAELLARDLSHWHR